MPLVKLTILDRTYAFSVSEEDECRLRSAGELIDMRAREIHQMDRGLTLERVAISAALQIAFDAMAGQLGETPEDRANMKKVAELRQRCELALQNDTIESS